MMKKSQFFYVGGYADNDSFCLHRCQYNQDMVCLTLLESYEMKNATSLCFSPDRRFLYATVETSEFKGCFGGGVAAYAIQEDGRLRFINDGYTQDKGPCHISVSDDGLMLYTANYIGGSTSIISIRADGGIGDVIKKINHAPLSKPSQSPGGRQEGAHAHFVKPVILNKVQTLWVCDLGLDCIFVFNNEGEELARYQTPAGYGPRHLSFHPLMPIVYAVCELNAAVIGLNYRFDGNNLRLEAACETSALKTQDTKNTCAEIVLSTDRRHLLVSNRGEHTNSISVLGLGVDGMITELKQIVGSCGLTPWTFQFSPSNDCLLVANTDSNSINVLTWDDKTGRLAATGTALSIQHPSCILFLH